MVSRRGTRSAGPTWPPDYRSFLPPVEESVGDHRSGCPNEHAFILSFGRSAQHVPYNPYQEVSKPLMNCAKYTVLNHLLIISKNTIKRFYYIRLSRKLK